MLFHKIKQNIPAVQGRLREICVCLYLCAAVTILKLVRFSLRNAPANYVTHQLQFYREICALCTIML